MLAPTGVAALNVGGQTIHSFFRFPPAYIDTDDIKPDPKRSRLFKNLDMVIIDEVSMVRADLMHGIDIALRKNRKKANEPFGGVQMVFIGDLFQLAPVLRDNDIDAIVKDFGGQYFFDAKVFKGFTYHFEELTTIFRQSPKQQQFKNLLNSIRNNKLQDKELALLNARHKSQGKTSDKITIDTGTGAFTHGQIYVALSRCTTFEGIRLNNPINKSDIIVDPRIVSFYNTRTIPAPTPIAPRTPKEVPAAILTVIKKAVKKKCAVEIVYEDDEGVKSNRQLSNLSFTNQYGYEERHIMAFCHMRRSVRTFNMARIKTVTIVEWG